MSSSVKYQKFEGLSSNKTPKENDVTEPEERHNMVKILLISAAVILGVVFIAATLAIGLGVGLSSSESQAEGLNVAYVTPQEVKGEYHGPATSITFLSTVNDTHFVLNIYTIDGELIVTIKRPLVSNMTLMSVTTTNFLIMEGQPNRPRYDDYIVPDDMMDIMDSMVMNNGNMTNDMLGKLDNKTVNETRESVLHNLATSPEAELIIEAALALGNDLGIQGTDYPAVMQFYQLALQLSKAKDFIQNDNSLTKRHAPEDNGLLRVRNRGLQRQKKETVTCDSNDATCRRGQCPFKKGSNNCFGLCGKGCTCWSFVCGNCCIHNYCLTHDQCCLDRGFFSYPCLSVAWRVLGSRCSQRYSC